MSRTVALPLPPTPEGAAALRRLWEAGDAVLPLDPQASPREVAEVIAVCRPDRVASVTDLHGRAADAPLPTADGTALVVPTSGSTGRRKGVVLGHRALDASTSASLARLGGTHGEVWRVPLPLHHVAGIMALRRGWALRTVPDVVPPGDLEALLADGAQHVAVVPTQLHRWMAADPHAGPRAALVGGAALDTVLRTTARDAGLAVTVSYGMTETAGGCVYDGRPLPGVEVRAADDGRLQVRGPVLFDGYRGPRAADDAAGPDADGWFTTGDLGTVAPDGRVTVHGRADDVAICGGENVPLGAVAAAVRDHDDVADAAAVAVPDPEWGQRVRVVVVVRAGASAPTLAALRDHVRAAHPAAWAPAELRVVERLPRDQMGKIRATALRAL